MASARTGPRTAATKSPISDSVRSNPRFTTRTESGICTCARGAIGKPWARTGVDDMDTVRLSVPGMLLSSKNQAQVVAEFDDESSREATHWACGCSDISEDGTLRAAVVA